MTLQGRGTNRDSVDAAMHLREVSYYFFPHAVKKKKKRIEKSGERKGNEGSLNGKEFFFFFSFDVFINIALGSDFRPCQSSTYFGNSIHNW